MIALLYLAVLYKPNFIVAFSGIIIGLLVGMATSRRTLRSVEKRGYYAQTASKFVAIVTVAVLAFAAFLYALFSGILPLSALVQLISIYAFLPASYLSAGLSYRSWELKNRKEVYSRGSWFPTIFAVPKGLQWQERERYWYELEYSRGARL